MTAMKILVANPNTTESVTNKVRAAAEAVAAAGTEVVAANPKKGPPSIEGYHDGASGARLVMASSIRSPAGDCRLR